VPFRLPRDSSTALRFGRNDGVISSRTEIARDAVALHYDELDHFYRDVWGEHVHHGLWLRGNESREEAVLQLAEAVAEQAAITAGTRVCDIGCGYGATSRLVAERGAEVTGITVSRAQYEFATRKHTSGNPQFVCGDWLTNDFASESFDAAIAIESSEHMADKPGFFAQAHRVLRPNGRLVVCAWLTAEQASKAAERWLLEPICREGRMPHMGTATDYQALARDAGFTLHSHRDVSREVARTWAAIARRLACKLMTNPRYARFLFSQHARNRVFALTTLRIWIAYRTGAMRYGIFTFVKN
jgi:tocopherol O-methyltransferase